MLSDLRLALRQFAKSPGFAAVAILTLAIAIGVNSAIFSLINAVLLRPAVPGQRGRVVCIYTASQDARRAFRQFSYAEYRTLRASSEVFTDVAALNFNFVSIGRDEEFRRSFAFMVSENYFELMGVRPVAGRGFTAEEARPNAGQRVVIAAYGLWERSGRRADFVGSTILVNGRRHTVIGVAPEGFSGLTALIAPDVWLPFGVFADVTPAFSDAREPRDLADPRTYTVNLVGRLQPGLTIDSARSRLPVLAARLDAMQPRDAAVPRDLVVTKPFNISPTPGDPGPLRVVGLLLLAMSGIVLLVACLNLANMMLARSASRRREIAVRLAIGAGARQIVRQLCAESLVLAVAGGALGLLMSTWFNVLLRNFFAARLGSMSFTVGASVQPDLAVIAATFVFCLLSTLAVGLGPAIKATRVDLARDLKAEIGEPVALGHWNRFFSGRHLMVMGQLALSTALIFAAGLFVRVALKAGGTGPDTGFDSRGVIVAELDFSLANTKPAEAMRRMLAAVERIRGLPGIQAAGLSTLVPYTDSITVARVTPATSAGAAAPTDVFAGGTNGIVSSITPGYFESLRVHLLRGRDFTDGEARHAGAKHVCLLDDGMARRLFPGRDAVGQWVRMADTSGSGFSGDLEVVGIVGRYAHGLEDKGNPVPNIYLPLGQAYRGALFLTARGNRHDPPAMQQAVAELRRRLRDLDPDLPVVQVLSFDAFAEKNFTLWMVRLGAVLFSLFGGIALVLAIVGVYGVKAYAVASRTHEIGIRMALGADRRDVFSLVMRQGVQQAALAVAVGVGLSFLVGRALAAAFFQVVPMDLVALGSSAAILCAGTLLACALPAKRATDVCPLTALRGR